MPLYNHQPLKIYNSLSGEKEPFVPVHEGNVGMYVCGPTVYSNVHLGNVRTFMSFDVIFRYLLHLEYKVRYVRNITDVGHIVDDVDEGEDKIAKYPVMFRSADLILITKTDLLPYFDYDIEKEKMEARKLKPNVDILEVNIKDKQSLQNVIDWINFKRKMR